MKRKRKQIRPTEEEMMASKEKMDAERLIEKMDEQRRLKRFKSLCPRLFSY